MELFNRLANGPFGRYRHVDTLSMIGSAWKMWQKDHGIINLYFFSLYFPCPLPPFKQATTSNQERFVIKHLVFIVKSLISLRIRGLEVRGILNNWKSLPRERAGREFVATKSHTVLHAEDTGVLPPYHTRWEGKHLVNGQPHSVPVGLAARAQGSQPFQRWLERTVDRRGWDPVFLSRTSALVLCNDLRTFTQA